ncbi:SDR family NAD(P)-dependent oxidoreductase [Leeuwenhoekiella marinoflava]|uniref:SDR family NAD(P)-dependent oxidoreductase n=1 Tax=Leeuwenhoekiella marinoflava TaxID=988 RepID=UPI003000FD49
MKKLENEVALITGAASGLGKVQAELFAKEGAKIIIADLDQEKSEIVAREINQNGGQAIGVSVNVTDGKSVDQLVKSALKEFGKISILSNTAGVFDKYSPLTQTSIEDFKKVMAVNVDGMYMVTKAVLDNMISNKHGIIINISSGAGLIGGGGGISYTTSKHAVIGFTRQLNAELGQQGIRANAIAPGLIQTPMVQDLIDDENSGIMETLKKIPAGRYGQSKEVADTALFLASEDSKYIYGAVIPVDGGLLSTLR